MSDLTDLYGDVILDHYKKPRNFRAMEAPDRRAVGSNPLCGDRLSVFLKLEGDRVKDVTFQGAGCAISQASASMMTQAVVGKTLPEIRVIAGKFREMVMRDATKPYESVGLEKLEVFSGVAEFPVRVKCAILAWHALEAALKGGEETVSTE
jgi:nitrogen fixation NifU-like protein